MKDTTFNAKVVDVWLLSSHPDFRKFSEEMKKRVRKYSIRMEVYEKMTFRKVFEMMRRGHNICIFDFKLSAYPGALSIQKMPLIASKGILGALFPNPRNASITILKSKYPLFRISM